MEVIILAELFLYIAGGRSCLLTPIPHTARLFLYFHRTHFCKVDHKKKKKSSENVWKVNFCNHPASQPSPRLVPRCPCQNSVDTKPRILTQNVWKLQSASLPYPVAEVSWSYFWKTPAVFWAALLYCTPKILALSWVCNEILMMLKKRLNSLSKFCMGKWKKWTWICEFMSEQSQEVWRSHGAS